MFQLSPRDLQSWSSSGLTTWLSSTRAGSDSRGVSTDGGRSGGYWGTIWRRMEEWKRNVCHHHSIKGNGIIHWSKIQAHLTQWCDREWRWIKLWIWNLDFVTWKDIRSRLKMKLALISLTVLQSFALTVPRHENRKWTKSAALGLVSSPSRFPYYREKGKKRP